MEEYLKTIGAGVTTVPALIAMEPKKDRNFLFDKMSKNIYSVDDVKTWVNDVLASRASHLMRSEKIDEGVNANALIKTLSHQNFNHYKESNKHLFVKFYTPYVLQ